MKVMLVFGTRPEAIKMCPLVIELKSRKNIDVKVCVTGQHEQMLQQVLDIFNVIPEYNLHVMSENQNLTSLTTVILNKFKIVLDEEKPDVVLVHGDTTTSFAASLSCFYEKIMVGHVEAGLRTNDMYSPFPEEFNRCCVGLISRFHFAPTKIAAHNLYNEGKNPNHVYICGNTSIDALKYTIKCNYENDVLSWVGDSKMILLTTHRRENHGIPMENIFKAITRITESHENVKVVFPVHLNPKIISLANKYFCNNEKVRMVKPLDVVDFHNFIKKSYLILTDSGGIQEEAPALGIPVLVLRETTERPEGIESGTLKLIGTNEHNIYNECTRLLVNINTYNAMAKANNPYGDGTSSKQIADILLFEMAKLGKLK